MFFLYPALALLQGLYYYKKKQIQKKNIMIACAQTRLVQI